MWLAPRPSERTIDSAADRMGPLEASGYRLQTGAVLPEAEGFGRGSGLAVSRP